jgi:Domain of unknown function (DUF222)
VVPGDLDGDDWDQDAAMAAFMADIECGYDLVTSSIGLEPDELDWPFPGDPGEWPGADGADGPAGDPAVGAPSRADGDAGPVAECLDPGSLPRGAAAPSPSRGSGSGFASRDVLDVALPDPALAGFADAAASGGVGVGRVYADLSDDELIGVLGGWRKTEAWAAAGRLSAVAELISRRPAESAGGPGTADGPTLGPSVIPGDVPAASGGTDCGGGPAAGNYAGDDGGGSNAPAAGEYAGGVGRGKIPAGWGKFCGDELAVAMAISRPAAERMLALAHDLAARLPLTARALHEGVIDLYKAQIIAEATRVLDDAAAAAAEAALLGAGVDGKTPGQIRAAAGRAVLHADPSAARRRREEAQKDARVELWREDAGTAALCGFGLPPDAALAADQRIRDRTIELKAAGVPGTMDQLRVRAYLDALLGQDTAAAARQDPCAPREPHDPGGAEPPAASTPDPGASSPGTGPGAPSAGMAAQINLTIPLATLLGLADRPGEAAGFGPIDADLARAMATAAATHPATTWCLTVTDPGGHPTAHGCARPTRGTKPRRPDPGGGGPAGPPPGPPPPQTEPPRTPGPGGNGRYGTWRLRPVANGPDLSIDVEPLAVTACDHRHQTRAHDPGGRLRHLIQIRDGDCTWPPCRRAARRCDFEHAIPWEAGGPTCACNAGARCRHHHHQKQAQGWKLEQHLPGYHTWTTPAGRSYTTGPTTYPV